MKSESVYKISTLMEFAGDQSPALCSTVAGDNGGYGGIRVHGFATEGRMTRPERQLEEELLDELRRINTDNSHHRYDVLLLINGVPVPQIELKILGISPRRAMEQIVEY